MNIDNIDHTFNAYRRASDPEERVEAVGAFIKASEEARLVCRLMQTHIDELEWYVEESVANRDGLDHRANLDNILAKIRNISFLLDTHDTIGE